MDVYRKAYYGEAELDDDFEKGHRLYIAGLMEMNPGKVVLSRCQFHHENDLWNCMGLLLPAMQCIIITIPPYRSNGKRRSG